MEIYIVAFGGFVLGFIVAMNLSSEDLLRKQAVEHGCASFVVVDSTKGTTEFQWRKK